jgi:hypothetical protein
MWSMHVAPDLPTSEDEYRALLARLYRSKRRRRRARVHGLDPAEEALEDLVLGLAIADQFGNPYEIEILGALLVSWCSHDAYPGPVPWLSRRLPLRLVRLILLALRAVPSEPVQPGSADDAVVRVPSAPLVRARSLLTAAPPASRAPVLAGAAA